LREVDWFTTVRVSYYLESEFMMRKTPATPSVFIENIRDLAVVIKIWYVITESLGEKVVLGIQKSVGIITGMINDI